MNLHIKAARMAAFRKETIVLAANGTVPHFSARHFCTMYGSVVVILVANSEQRKFILLSMTGVVMV